MDAGCLPGGVECGERIVIGEIGMLRLCGWAAIIFEWVFHIILPIFVGLIAIFGAWCIIVFVCALIGAIRRRRK